MITLDDQITLKQIHPKLRPVVDAFMHKTQNRFAMFGGGRLYIEDDGDDKSVQFPSTVAFYDKSALDMPQAGAIKWQHGDFGKPYKFRVVTRTVVSPKYRDTERQKSIETQSDQLALRQMFKHITPFTISEMAEKYKGGLRSTINEWRSEGMRERHEIFGIPEQVIVEEVTALLNAGIKFTTPEFQHIAVKGIEMHHEAVRREKTVIHPYFVRFMGENNIVVRGEKKTLTYHSFNGLPEFIQEGVGVLRILSNGQRIASIGAKITDNTFWILQHEEKA